MKHTWLVGILAGALLAGSAAVQAQQKPAAQVPTGEVALGTITLPRAVTADGKPLPGGRYTLRLTAQAAAERRNARVRSDNLKLDRRLEKTLAFSGKHE